jgi:hypothetical protein
MKKKINHIVRKYFLAFEKKNISTLKSLFEEKIILHDWNNYISGKSKVIIFNKKIFSQFKNIKVRIKNIFFNEKKLMAACMIDVVLNKSKTRVIDIIYFNKKMKIKKLQAYKL